MDNLGGFILLESGQNSQFYLLLGKGLTSSPISAKEEGENRSTPIIERRGSPQDFIYLQITLVRRHGEFVELKSKNNERPTYNIERPPLKFTGEEITLPYGSYRASRFQHGMRFQSKRSTLNVRCSHSKIMSLWCTGIRIRNCAP